MLERPAKDIARRAGRRRWFALHFHSFINKKLLF
jgi:hypothetical protein